MQNELINIDEREYSLWLHNLCEEIDNQRLRAVMKLNASTLQHYWWLGNDILFRQKKNGWGAKIIDKLSADLQKRYGKDSGYSVRNLKYMRQFANDYPDFPFVQVPLAQLTELPVLQTRFSKFAISVDGEFVQVPLAQITWYHHISLLSKIKDTLFRAFYITETALQGWSRDMMLMQIDNHYEQKINSLPNNFTDTLPPTNSDFAKAVFKDPYNLGFIELSEMKQELDLENQLATKITEFLLELGKGFAYLGRQYPLIIEGEEYKVDLMMYHTQLHCYVAVELKVTDFKPEYLSKLNFYISAIDDLVKTNEDNPTIGLLLCRSKNNTKVEYALRGMTQPLGVAEYKINDLFKNLKSSLPSVDELEKTLND